MGASASTETSERISAPSNGSYMQNDVDEWESQMAQIGACGCGDEKKKDEEEEKPDYKKTSVGFMEHVSGL